MQGDAIDGYGIYAKQSISASEVIYKGETFSQRLVTRRYVTENWNKNEQEIFRRYAYPVSKEVFLLWDLNPAEWAPQNHSCEANTAYDGLNVITTKNIQAGEELTLDYGSFLDERMEPFTCKCGAATCRGFITGQTDNSVTEKELHRNGSHTH